MSAIDQVAATVERRVQTHAEAAEREMRVLADIAVIEMYQRSRWVRPPWRVTRSSPTARVERLGAQSVRLVLEHGPFFGRELKAVQGGQYAVLRPVVAMLRARLANLILGGFRS